MVSFPIVDAHVHLWDPARLPIPWLAGAPALNRRYAVEELRAALAEPWKGQENAATVQVACMVYVEVDASPEASIAEVELVGAWAREEPRIRAIVAHAPVEQGGDVVRPHIESLLAASPLVRGMRRNIQDEADAGFSLQPSVIESISMLGTYGLSFDLCVRAWQLPAVTELVRRCPGTHFILDHMGKPPIRDGVVGLDPWRDNLAHLAELPNVVCKVSGIVTEANVENWNPDDLRPYITHTLAVFGPERVLFGGDWPVLTLASSYARWVTTLDELTASLSLAQRQALWAGNASTTYRLEI